MFLAWSARYSSANLSNSAAFMAIPVDRRPGWLVRAGRGRDLVDKEQGPTFELRVHAPEIGPDDGKAGELARPEEHDDQGLARPARDRSPGQEADQDVEGDGAAERDPKDREQARDP